MKIYMHTYIYISVWMHVYITCSSTAISELYVYTCVNTKILIYMNNMNLLLYIMHTWCIHNYIHTSSKDLQSFTQYIIYTYIYIHTHIRVAYPWGEASLRGPEGRIWPDDFSKKNLPWGTVLNFGNDIGRCLWRRRNVWRPVHVRESFGQRLYTG